MQYDRPSTNLGALSPNCEHAEDEKISYYILIPAARVVCTCPWKLVGRLRWWTFGPIVGPVWDFKLSEVDICGMTIIFTAIHIDSLIKQPSGRSFPSIVEAHWYQFPFLGICTLFMHSQVLLKSHKVVYLKAATATPSLLAQHYF